MEWDMSNERVALVATVLDVILRVSCFSRGICFMMIELVNVGITLLISSEWFAAKIHSIIGPSASQICMSSIRDTAHCVHACDI